MIAVQMKQVGKNRLKISVLIAFAQQCFSTTQEQAARIAFICQRHRFNGVRQTHLLRGHLQCQLIGDRIGWQQINNGA